MENIPIDGTKFTFEKDGVKFTTFVSDGKRYLCTGDPTAVCHHYTDETYDMYHVEGATSVIRREADTSIAELYEEWLRETEVERSIGIEF